VLNPHSFAGNGVRVSRDVTCRIDIARTGAQVFVDYNAVIYGQAAAFGQCRFAATPYPKTTSSASIDCPSLSSTRSSRMIRGVAPDRKRTPFCSWRSWIHRPKLPTPTLSPGDVVPYDCDFETSMAERSSHFEADKTGANHDTSPGSLRLSDDRFAVSQGS